MAKVIDNLLISSIRGRFKHEIIFSHNQYGPYTKQYKVPKDPQSPGQLNYRATMAIWVKEFTKPGHSHLRTIWNDYASQHGLRMSGFNLFVRAGLNWFKQTGNNSPNWDGNPPNFS